MQSGTGPALDYPVGSEQPQIIHPGPRGPLMRSKQISRLGQWLFAIQPAPILGMR
jgi:hypothetical protein